MRLFLLLFVTIFGFARINFVLTLECGVILGDTKKELKEVIKTCMVPTIPVIVVQVDNTTKPANFTDEDDPELQPSYGPRRGMGKRNKRQETVTNAPVVTTLMASSTTTTTTMNPILTSFENNKPKKKIDPKKCVVRCILKEFQMLDGQKMPDHKQISERLLKNIEDREFRDFIQDSIDDCFGQMLELAEKDSCGYAAQLITCLADKGRYNCADWPVGELPFPHTY